MTVSSDGEVGVVGSDCGAVSPFVGKLFAFCDDDGHGWSSFVEEEDGCPISSVAIDVTIGLLTDAFVGVVGESSVNPDCCGGHEFVGVVGEVLLVLKSKLN